MDSAQWADTRDAFRQAARWFVSVTAAGAGRWDETALGEWTVRDLVGHTSRALLTVETYLDRPADAVQVSTPVDYLLAVSAAAVDSAAVAQRGRDAGAALGADITAAVAQIADRVLTRVDAEPDHVLVSTIVGGMRLGDYLPTRTFELTVHSCDLAVALDRPLDVPPAAAAASLQVLGGLAVARGGAGPLLLAATGHGRLPAGFTVL